MNRSRLGMLSEQERACLRLVPLRNTAEVARLTGLSPETVKTYLRRAREKLGVNRTTDAARLLLEAERCPPDRGSPSRVTDALTSPFQSEPQQEPEQAVPDTVLHEERASFQLQDRSVTAREGRARHDRYGLTILLQIAGLVIAFAVIILLAGPLSQSAQTLANLISPP